MIKRNRLILVFVALILIHSGCANKSSERQIQITESSEIQIEEQITESSNYSAQDKEPIYLNDAYDLISVVEKTHPAFVLDDIRDDYEQEKQEFINSITSETTKDEFILLVRKYLTVFQDGHTFVVNDTNKRFLDVNCRAAGKDLFLINEDGSLSKDRITHIGGVPLYQILETVQDYHVAENDAAKDLNNSMWALNDEVLNLAGCDIDSGFAELTVDQNGTFYKKKISFVSKDIYECYNYTFGITSRKIDNIYYIDMNICEENKNLETQINKLKKALESGVTKIIIDVTNNRGGNSKACTRLLNAMGMTPPSYGCFIRYSELAHENRGVPSEGFEKYDPDKTQAKRNEKINLVVLTNERTYSSATMIAVFVKDGGLGTIIGTPSSNSPSAYGDILYYQLPVSKINVAISYKRFLRPDTNADQRILIPDIVTEYNADILQTAMDYLSKS